MSTYAFDAQIKHHHKSLNLLSNLFGQLLLSFGAYPRLTGFVIDSAPEYFHASAYWVFAPAYDVTG
jgi:hypothetical protein